MENAAGMLTEVVVVWDRIVKCGMLEDGLSVVAGMEEVFAGCCTALFLQTQASLYIYNSYLYLGSGKGVRASSMIKRVGRVVSDSGFRNIETRLDKASFTCVQNGYLERSYHVSSNVVDALSFVAVESQTPSLGPSTHRAESA